MKATNSIATRKLSGLERFFLHKEITVQVAFTLRGAFSPEHCSQAVEIATENSPLVQLAIDKETVFKSDNNIPYLGFLDVMESNLCVFNNNNNNNNSNTETLKDWSTNTMEKIRTQFSLGCKHSNNRLFVYGITQWRNDWTGIVFHAHHAFCDGRSLESLVRRTVLALGSRNGGRAFNWRGVPPDICDVLHTGLSSDVPGDPSITIPGIRHDVDPPSRKQTNAMNPFQKREFNSNDEITIDFSSSQNVPFECRHPITGVQHVYPLSPTGGDPSHLLPVLGLAIIGLALGTDKVSSPVGSNPWVHVSVVTSLRERFGLPRDGDNTPGFAAGGITIAVPIEDLSHDRKSIGSLASAIRTCVKQRIQQGEDLRGLANNDLRKEYGNDGLSKQDDYEANGIRVEVSNMGKLNQLEDLELLQSIEFGQGGVGVPEWISLLMYTFRNTLHLSMTCIEPLCSLNTANIVLDQVSTTIKEQLDI